MRRLFGKPATQTALRYVGTALSLGLLFYLISQQGWQEIGESVRQVSIGRLALVAALAFLSRLAIAGRWTCLLLLSGVDVPLGRIMRITFAGLFASNFLPTSIGGDIVRLAGAVQLESQRGKYVSSIAVDRLVGLFANAMLLPVGVAQVLAGPGLAAIGGLKSWGMPLPVLALAAGNPSLEGGKNRIRDGLRRALEIGRLWISSPRALLASFGFAWVNVMLRFSSMWLLFNALGAELGYWQIAGLWSFVYIISLFPVSINSWGLQEVSAGLVFSTVGGVATTTALTVALLMRTVETLASLPGVIALPGLMALRSAQTRSDADSQ
jgi:hypothetical protein